MITINNMQYLKSEVFLLYKYLLANIEVNRAMACQRMLDETVTSNSITQNAEKAGKANKLHNVPMKQQYLHGRSKQMPNSEETYKKSKKKMWVC